MAGAQCCVAALDSRRAKVPQALLVAHDGYGTVKLRAVVFGAGGCCTPQRLDMLRLAVRMRWGAHRSVRELVGHDFAGDGPVLFVDVLKENGDDFWRTAGDADACFGERLGRLPLRTHLRL